MSMTPALDPEPEPLTEASPPSPWDALHAWQRGDVGASDVSALADLSRADAELLAQRWPALGEETRIAVARTMSELAEERFDLHFGRALRLMLDDPSATVRQLAVAALWEDEGADLPGRLLTIIAADPSQDVVAQAIQSLAATSERVAMSEIDPDQARHIAAILLGTADDVSLAPTVRRRALEVGAVCGDARRVTHLIEEFYEADEPGFRASAVYAMGRTADRRWLPLILAEFGDDDAELRFEAARAAGELGDSSALPGLIELAADEDPEVRQAAIGAIGHIGGRSGVRALEHLAANAGECDADAIEEARLEAETSVDPLGVER